MDQLEIQVEPRDVFGKKVRFLRRQGLIPANVFGSGIASAPVQVETKALEQAIGQAGTSKLVTLRLPKEREPRRALVREVRRDPLTGMILHVSFYQVRMTEKLKAEIRLNLVGEAPATAGGQGVLIHGLSSVEVECLPGDLPESIRVDVSGLETFDDAVHVRDLSVPDGVTILASPDELVAKVAPIRAEKEAEEVAAEAEKPEAPEEAAPALAKEEGEEAA